MRKGVRESFNKARLSSSQELLFIPFGLVGIASLIVLLAMQAGLVGSVVGIALVGVSSFVTTHLVKRYPDHSAASNTGATTPGWLKLLYTAVDIWMLWTGQTNNPSSSSPPFPPSWTASERAIAILDAVPGITIAHTRDFKKSRPFARLQDGTVVRRWINPVGVEHVFLADDNNQIIYGGFVGWIHTQGLQQAIAQIKRELT